MDLTDINQLNPYGANLIIVWIIVSALAICFVLIETVKVNVNK
jgi:hypothetical protein